MALLNDDQKNLALLLWMGDLTMREVVMLPKNARAPGQSFVEIARHFRVSSGVIRKAIYNQVRETPEYEMQLKFLLRADKKSDVKHFGQAIMFEVRWLA